MSGEQANRDQRRQVRRKLVAAQRARLKPKPRRPKPKRRR